MHHDHSGGVYGVGAPVVQRLRRPWQPCIGGGTVHTVCVSVCVCAGGIVEWQGCVCMGQTRRAHCGTYRPVISFEAECSSYKGGFVAAG